MTTTASVERETARIEAFSDGVFSIAITLLGLELKVHFLGVDTTVATLRSFLWNNWPSYLAFVSSFAGILIMWISHHGMFKAVHRVDKAFIFANGFLLMLVTVVPFTTALVAEYFTTPAAPLVCAIYSGFFVITNVAYNMLWYTAIHKRVLLKPHITEEHIAKTSKTILLGLPLYAIAAGAAFINVYVSMGICSFLWIYWALVMKIE